MRVSEFIDRMADEMDVSRDRAQAAYRAFLEVARFALSRGEEVSLQRIGKLTSFLRTEHSHRPQLESEQRKIVEVTFTQFPSSRLDLLKTSPFLEELSDEPEAGRGDYPEGDTDRGSADVRNEPH